MGWAVSWLAVPKGKKEHAWREFDVELVQQEDFEEREPLLVGFEFGDWYILQTAQRTYSFDEKLPDVSKGTELITCFVHEGCMASSASSWKNGQEIWSILHENDRGVNDLQVKGTPPPPFEQIRARQIALQDQQTKEREAKERKSQKLESKKHELKKQDLPRPEKLEAMPIEGVVEVQVSMRMLSLEDMMEMGVDYIFDVPIDLAETLVGFRHDRHDDRNSNFDYLAPPVGKEPIYDHKWFLRRIKPELEKLGLSPSHERLDGFFSTGEDENRELSLCLMPAGIEQVFLFNPSITVMQREVFSFIEDLNRNGLAEWPFHQSFPLGRYTDAGEPVWQFFHDNPQQTEATQKAFLDLLQSMMPFLQRYLSLELTEEDIEQAKHCSRAEYYLVTALVMGGRKDLASKVGEDFKKDAPDIEAYQKFLDHVLKD